MRVSHMTHIHSLNDNHIFIWRQQYQNVNRTAVSTSEEVILAFERTAVMKQIQKLQWWLKKIMKLKLFKAAVE